MIGSGQGLRPPGWPSRQRAPRRGRMRLLRAFGLSLATCAASSAQPGEPVGMMAAQAAPAGSSGAVAVASAEPMPTTETPLPYDLRAWECVPGVIRTNGFESFRLEVSLGMQVARVTINSVSPNIVSPQTPPFDLEAQSRTSGDFVFIAGPFRYNPAFPMRTYYMDDPDSPSGLDFTEFADVTITEQGGATSTFLLKPAIGLLRADIPAVWSGTFGGSTRVSKHFVNVWTGDRQVALKLRNGYNYPDRIAQYFYMYLTDFADTIAMVSTAHLEWVPQTEPLNYVSGAYEVLKVDYSGTGRSWMDYSSIYHSAGRLHGVAFLDSGARGLTSSNALHEILHQWCGKAHWQITDVVGHYLPNTSVGSLVGGHTWTAGGNGSWTLDCNEGRNGAHHACPLDKYMMGLIEGSAVPPIQIYDEYGLPPLKRCRQPFSDVVGTVTIEDIRNTWGPRTPGPATAQRAFSIAFVGESHRQLFNDTEMTFYDRLAEHFSKQLPPEAPDPYVGCNWVPVSRFFGEGTTWDTSVRLSYDLDHDGDVDQDDITIFRGCSQGSDIRVWDSFCQTADFDRDGDVDLDDFAGMQRCISGPGIPADLSCGPP
jgi:hypothetical protein